MAENTDDIKRIEVGLSILSGAETDRFYQFADSMKAFKEFLQAIDPKSLADSLNQAAVAAEKVRAQSERVRGHSEKMQGQSASPSIEDVPSPGHTWFNQQLAQFPRTYTGADAGASAALAEMRAQATGSSTQDVAQEAQEEGVDNSQPTSNPSRLVNSLNTWTRSLRRMSHGHIGVGAAMFGGAHAGMDAGEEMPTTIMGSLGGLGKAGVETALIGTLATSAFNTMRNAQHAITNPLQTAMGLANPYTAQEVGAQLGYQRSGGFLGLPFMGPFSSATEEGLRQSLDIGQLALKPGINIGQAQQIEQASSQFGFSGSFGSSVTDQLLAPLFQKFGMNPQQVLQNFGAGLRTGVITVQQLRGHLEELGQAAQAASMSLTDTSNAVASANQAVSTIGGTPQTGIAFGNQFQQVTGLPANVGAQLITNPFVQSIIAMDTGVMPALQGTLGPTTLMGGVTQSVQMLSTLFGHAFPGRTQDITDPTGKSLYTRHESSQQQSDALIAHYLGLDVGQVKRLRQYGDPQQWGTTLIGLANNYTNQVGPHGTHITNQEVQKELERQIKAGTVNLADYPSTPLGMRMTNLPAGAHIIGYDTGKNTYKVRLQNGHVETLQAMEGSTDVNQLLNEVRGSETHGSLTQIENEIRKSHLWTQKGTQNEINHINKIDREKGPQAAARAVRTSVSNQLKNAYQNIGQGGQTISIVMKGQAAKNFKAYPSQIIINANSGTGPTPNYQIATPQGMSPLMGYTPYDSASGYGQ